MPKKPKLRLVAGTAFAKPKRAAPAEPKLDSLITINSFDLDRLQERLGKVAMALGEAAVLLRNIKDYPEEPPTGGAA